MWHKNPSGTIADRPHPQPHNPLAPPLAIGHGDHHGSHFFFFLSFHPRMKSPPGGFRATVLLGWTSKDKRTRCERGLSFFVSPISLSLSRGRTFQSSRFLGSGPLLNFMISAMASSTYTHVIPIKKTKKSVKTYCILEQFKQIDSPPLSLLSMTRSSITETRTILIWARIWAAFSVNRSAFLTGGEGNNRCRAVSIFFFFFSRVTPWSTEAL